MKKVFQLILTVLAYLFLSTTIIQLALNIYFKFKSTDLIFSTLFMIFITILTFYVKILLEDNKKSTLNTNLSLGLIICFIILFSNYLLKFIIYPNNPNKNMDIFLYSSFISLIILLLISLNSIKKYFKRRETL